MTCTIAWLALPSNFWSDFITALITVNWKEKLKGILVINSKLRPNSEKKNKKKNEKNTNSSWDELSKNVQTKPLKIHVIKFPKFWVRWRKLAEFTSDARVEVNSAWPEPEIGKEIGCGRKRKTPRYWLLAACLLTLWERSFLKSQSVPYFPASLRIYQATYLGWQSTTVSIIIESHISPNQVSQIRTDL